MAINLSRYVHENRGHNGGADEKRNLNSMRWRVEMGRKEVERGRIECRRWKVISGWGWEMAGSRSMRRDVRSVGWENWLRDDGGRVENGSLNERRF